MRKPVILVALAAAAASISFSTDVRAAEAAASSAAAISTQDFAALPQLYRPLLSPDGRRIVARVNVAGQTKLAIMDADRPELTPKLIALGETDLAALRWAGNQRLLLTVMASQKLSGGVQLPFLRLLAIDTATGDSRLVDSKSRGILAGEVLYADPTGSWALVASQDNVAAYPSVKRVDLATGDAKLVEKARDGVWDWYADDRGVVRLGISTSGRRWTIWYRKAPGDKLKAKRGRFPKQDDSAVDRFIFGRDDKSWIITNERTGRFAVYRYDLRSNEVGEAVYEHPEVDIESAIYDSESDTIIGVNYEDDRQRTVWFDPESRDLQARLDKALPKSVI